MAKYNGPDRRAEPDLDILSGGKYYGIVGQVFYSPYPNDKNVEKYVPGDILETVNNSEGRLEVKIRSEDDDEDCYTEFRIKAVERRKI